METTVFVSSVTARCAALVTEHAGRCFSNVQVVPCEDGFITAWHAACKAIGEGSAYYVTECETLDDDGTSFAVFHARVPTLTLVPCECLSPLMMCPAQDCDTRDDSVLSALVASFFAVSPSSGPVVVMEGGDGAGKATQTRMLVEHLKADGRVVETLDFPHDRSLLGDLTRVILSGKKGGIAELDPRLFSFIYSLNRFGCLPELRLWRRKGMTIVLDRYYTANYGHQASKLPPDSRKEFIHHLERSEVDWLGLPRADVVYYLDLPPRVALEAMRKDSDRRYLDIHETAGGNYKQSVRETYLWCCTELQNWQLILCCDDEGNRYDRKTVHERVYSKLIATSS